MSSEARRNDPFDECTPEIGDHPVLIYCCLSRVRSAFHDRRSNRKVTSPSADVPFIGRSFAVLPLEYKRKPWPRESVPGGEHVSTKLRGQHPVLSLRTASSIESARVVNVTAI